MALEMKEQCERCQSSLAPDGRAFICAFECSFCDDCAGAMNRVCPNCGGELVLRPRRVTPADPVDDHEQSRSWLCATARSQGITGEE